MNRAVCRMSRICSPGMPEMMLVLWPLPCRGQMLQYLYCIAGLREGGREGGREKEGNKLLRSDGAGQAGGPTRTDREKGRGGNAAIFHGQRRRRAASAASVLLSVLGAAGNAPFEEGLSFPSPRDKLVVGEGKGDDTGGKFEFCNCFFVRRSFFLTFYSR